jgi:hypothetical protein
MLMNPATGELLHELFYGSGARKKRRTDLTPEQVAEGRLIKNDKGKIGIPAEYLFSCLCEAGRMVKYDGRRMLSTASDSFVPGLINLEEEFIVFDGQEEGNKLEWRLDFRRGRLQDGTAVAIARPRIPHWSACFHLRFEPQEVAESKVQDLVRQAGRKPGLGDWRPGCKGRFGRFVVSGWETAAVDTLEVEEAAA